MHLKDFIKTAIEATGGIPLVEISFSCSLTPEGQLDGTQMANRMHLHFKTARVEPERSAEAPQGSEGIP